MRLGLENWSKTGPDFGLLSLELEESFLTYGGTDFGLALLGGGGGGSGLGALELSRKREGVIGCDMVVGLQLWISYYHYLLSLINIMGMASIQLKVLDEE